MLTAKWNGAAMVAAPPQAANCQCDWNKKCLCEEPGRSHQSAIPSGCGGGMDKAGVRPLTAR